MEAKGHKLCTEKWLNFQRSKTCGLILSKLLSHDMAIKKIENILLKLDTITFSKYPLFIILQVAAIFANYT